MDIRLLLRSSKVVAVVGLSERPDRPSYDVASYLMEHGFTIIPVNPNITEWQGIKAYPSLLAIPEPQRSRIDIVDIFRKSADVPPVVEEAISIKAKAVWMQLGIVNEPAARKAESAGIVVVMDRCMKIEHMRL